MQERRSTSAWSGSKVQRMSSSSGEFLWPRTRRAASAKTPTSQQRVAAMASSTASTTSNGVLYQLDESVDVLV